MSIRPGQKLLHYELVERIGEGGMGVVWKARDTTLDREVAIKVLSEPVAASAERHSRFDREAKLLASLNHPNIASIYGFHESQSDEGPVRFVAMELVRGEDLAQRLARGPIPVDETLELAEQIATSLAAAHDKGVIHRDLKPANIRITPDGTVKVLDFGLAKSLDVEPLGGSGSLSSSPTVTSGGTAIGMILGTAGYMSPEQARGRSVDRRADMWAFGCVLYEMLTGSRAFAAETITDTLAAVIGRDPDWDRLPPTTPASVRRLLKRCLAKKAAERVRDAADARLELTDAAETQSQSRTRRGVPAWALAVLALVAAAAIIATWVSRPASRESVFPESFNLTGRQVTFTGDIFVFRLAPDGRTAVAMTSDYSRVLLLDLEGGGSQTLYTSPEGETLHDLCWSPDGSRVYLMSFPFANRVFSVPRLGGAARQELDLRDLVGLDGITVRPLSDGRWLVYGSKNTVYVGNDPTGLRASGTQLVGEGVFKIPGVDRLWTISPSGNARWLAFRGLDPDEKPVSGVVGVDGSGGPGVIPEWTSLLPGAWGEDDLEITLYRPLQGGDVLPGGLDVLRGAVDPETGRAAGEPKRIYPRLESLMALRAVPEVSRDGRRLVYLRGDRVQNLLEIVLDATPDASDNEQRTRTTGTGRWTSAAYSPDGRLLAAQFSDFATEVFWISDDGTRRSLLRMPGYPPWIAFSPGGDSIALTGNDEWSTMLVRDLASGRSQSIQLPEAVSWFDWSPDGKRIVAMSAVSADGFVVVDVPANTAKTVAIDCQEQCEFASETIQFGPRWPWAAVTSEVDTWVLNVETGALRHLATDTWGVVDWQADQVYFERTGGQTDWPGSVLYRIPAEGGAEERLLDLPLGCGRNPGFRSSYSALSPDGRSVVCVEDESRVDLWVVSGL